MIEASQSLSARFERFVQTLDGFESIDSLLKTNDPDGKRRADYLCAGRTLILEQKTLKVDPKTKPQKFVDRLMKERGMIVFGTVSTRPIFEKLPDGQKQYRRMIHKLTSVIEAAVSSADKQTRDTRVIFGIPKAAGVLVLLNQEARILTTDLIRYRVHELFKKSAIDGSVRYPHNQVVILISELHPIGKGAVKLLPIETYVNGAGMEPQPAIAYCEMLKARWAQFNGVPLVDQRSGGARNS
jgi:hypothetical protein